MEEAKTNKLKLVGANNGFAIKKNGLVDLKIECDGSQLAKVLQLLQYANASFAVVVKMQDGNTILGKEFMFKTLSIDRDGEAKLVLEADKSSVKMDAVQSVYQMEELVTFVFCQHESAV